MLVEAQMQVIEPAIGMLGLHGVIPGWQVVLAGAVREPQTSPVTVGRDDGDARCAGGGGQRGGKRARQDVLGGLSSSGICVVGSYSAQAWRTVVERDVLFGVMLTMGMYERGVYSPHEQRVFGNARSSTKSPCSGHQAKPTPDVSTNINACGTRLSTILRT
jgi:hypothetical protein